MAMTRMVGRGWALVAVIGSMVALGIGAGCGGSGMGDGDTTPPTETPPTETPPVEEVPPAPPVEVMVRMIHAAANGVTRTYAVTAARGSEAPAPVATGLGFGTASAYTAVSLPAGSTAIELSVQGEGIEAFSFGGNVGTGDRQTGVLSALADSGDQLEGVLLRDVTQAPATDATRARFLHAVVGWNTLDVCFSPTPTSRAPVFAGAERGRIAGEPGSTDHYVDLPAGVSKLQVRQGNAANPCGGRLVGMVTLPPGALPGQNVTFIAIGRTAGGPTEPPAMLMCVDSPAPAPSCTSLAMPAR